MKPNGKRFVVRAALLAVFHSCFPHWDKPRLRMGLSNCQPKPAGGMLYSPPANINSL